jgi:hypothetical protein
MCKQYNAPQCAKYITLQWPHSATQQPLHKLGYKSRSSTEYTANGPTFASNSQFEAPSASSPTTTTTTMPTSTKPNGPFAPNFNPGSFGKKTNKPTSFAQQAAHKQAPTLSATKKDLSTKLSAAAAVSKAKVVKKNKLSSTTASSTGSSNPRQSAESQSIHHTLMLPTPLL